MTGFAVLPPEVNSGRMYAGAGSAPLLAAAAGWDRLAAALTSAAGSYRSVTTTLTDGPWQGGSAVAMSAAAQPFSAWLDATAAQAAVTAEQARVAAAAYEAAFAATVPPPVIAANRAALSTLVNGNVLGQNTAAIATNQADYEQMWAQDVTAMQTYAAGSAAAAPDSGALSAAPQTTNSAGTGTQAGAAAQTGSSILDWNPFGEMANSPLLQNATVQGLDGFFNSAGALLLQTTGTGLSSEGSQLAMFPLYLLSGKVTMLGPTAAMGAATGAGLASSTTTGGSVATLANAAAPAASASTGRAVPVGKLSVPPSWGVASGDVRLAGAAMPAASSPIVSTPALPSAGMVPPVMGGPVAGMVNSPVKAAGRQRAGAGGTVPVRHPGAADADDAEQNRSVLDIALTVTGLNQREQDELHKLRGELADLATGCDELARLTREAMR
ncbi:PPE family protein [[Mycobacterium] zoologicum]|uniref:PPE family protein n=1 Tax=[Mycobacterium] zoologicum TaxID=2872311 RepID=UPI002C1BD4F0|nr:PPE family protein [Mycolicibacter sp. MYC101]MEB3062077.1 PPE family protein [Mycolicibacter sp. MYC101]